MDKDTALRLALGALEKMQNAIYNIGGEHVIDLNFAIEQADMSESAITAIKAALEAKDEPVAYVETKEVHGQMCSFIYRADSTKLLPDGTKLYIAPPQRKPLTDEEMQRIIHEHTKLNPNQRDDKQLIGYIINATRAIEAAHGIKGEA